MKLLVAMCLMAAGVSASYGPAGIVHPDGRLEQLTREQAENIAVVGDSGVTFHDGSHIQFNRDAALHHAGIVPPMPVPVMLAKPGLYGATGIVMPDGGNVQFTYDQAANIAVIGPSGVVKFDGKNVQLNDEGLPSRKKREVLLEGPSGVLFKDGQFKPLPRGVSIVLLTKSGAVFSNGDNVQFSK
ncbi:cuticle protein CP1243-like [Portunus trituberculatus]|uniref:cuticle protein CP1243-like n=1 Tax=Portunus trituberculatus TaxID=210409 RepID=UPI001E1CC826|nr:cuticle protein CP1243-like [Portunus trituberculatus]XP_045114720.1 cuticle protein CP1243-like [Portunus trituberculatus]